jgi:hypothetical protein
LHLEQRFPFSSGKNLLSAGPVAAQALIAHTLNRGFGSRLGHGCLSASFCVVLSCVGRGLTTS